MTKFQQLMSDSSNTTLVRRSATIATQAKIAQETLVNDLTNKIASKQLELQNLTDFAPESTESLRPGSKDWDPVVWASNIQNIKMELWSLNEQLKQAKETYQEFFSEVPSDK